MFRSLVSTPEDPLSEARRLHELDPGFIICRPTHLRRLSLSLKQLGLVVRPGGVQATQETLTKTCRRDLEEAFDTKVFRSYGSTEFDGVGFECQEQTGLHMAEDFALAEVLKDGEAVGPGETGELVMTSLHNEIMPLIRYRTGDIVQVAEEERCGCGSSLMKLSAIHGRAEDGLVTEGGDSVLSLQVADYLESELGLRDFQLVQLAPGEVVFRCAKGDSGNSELLARVETHLESLLGLKVKLKVEERPREEFWDKYRPVLRRMQ